MVHKAETLVRVESFDRLQRPVANSDSRARIVADPVDITEDPQSGAVFADLTRSFELTHCADPIERARHGANTVVLCVRLNLAPIGRGLR